MPRRRSRLQAAYGAVAMRTLTRTQVLDVPAQQEVSRGPLPLSRGAALRWLGLDPSDGAPAALDTTGVLRVWSAAFGGAWLPALDAGDEARTLWPVGVHGGELRYFDVAASGHPEVRLGRGC